MSILTPRKGERFIPYCFEDGDRIDAISRATVLLRLPCGGQLFTRL